MITAMVRATAGSSQYQPPVARMIAPLTATPAAAAASAARAGGDPDRQQRDADGGGVREVVRPCREDGQRVRGQSHDHERRDETEVEKQDDSQAPGAGHASIV